jgi:hypothetical protein
MKLADEYLYRLSDLRTLPLGALLIAPQLHQGFFKIGKATCDLCPKVRCE